MPDRYKSETERAVAERRAVDRVPATGRAVLSAIATGRRIASGEMVDISGSGFRMKHDCTSLVSGDVVRFENEFGTGIARVAWTRVLGGGVQSGLMVISFD